MYRGRQISPLVVALAALVGSTLGILVLLPQLLIVSILEWAPENL